MTEQNNMINHISALITGARGMAQIIIDLESMYGGNGDSDRIVNVALSAANKIEQMITKPEDDGPHSEFENLFEEHLCHSKKVCGD